MRLFSLRDRHVPKYFEVWDLYHMGILQKKAIEEHTTHCQKNAYTILLLLVIMS